MGTLNVADKKREVFLPVTLLLLWVVNTFSAESLCLSVMTTNSTAR